MNNSMTIEYPFDQYIEDDMFNQDDQFEFRYLSSNCDQSFFFFVLIDELISEQFSNHSFD